MKWILFFITLTLFAGMANAQTAPTGPVPFTEFLKDLRGTQSTRFVLQPGYRVKDLRSFQEMKQHLLKLYAGVEVTHSFLYGPDTIDCIPAMQQPAVRIQGLKSLAKPPPPLPEPKALRPVAAPGASLPLQVKPTGAEVDENKVMCERGTIPMRRLTLDVVAQFESLNQFFRKKPYKSKAPLSAGVQQDTCDGKPAEHLYAISMQKGTPNIGGGSDLNIWRPSKNVKGTCSFSLSQIWVVNHFLPFDPDAPQAQTLEAGWHVYPCAYNNKCGDPLLVDKGRGNDTRLFIFATNNNYGEYSNGGLLFPFSCYNLDCGAFVQPPDISTWILGTVLAPTSTVGKAQYYISVGYSFYDGDWWLSINGQWVGYYPGSIFAPGPLGSASPPMPTELHFGGETYGTKVFPEMGSGRFAATDCGYTCAAFQKNMYYINDQGNADYITLTDHHQSSPQCYTELLWNNTNVAGWNTYMFFGGKGGRSCPAPP